MKRVWDHPDAAAERDEAAAWYEERVPGLGMAFYAAVDECVAAIAENPGLFPIKTNGVHTCLLPLVFPYSIYYVERESDIVILAYAHQKRRPNYWSRRIGYSPVDAESSPRQKEDVSISIRRGETPRPHENR